MGYSSKGSRPIEYASKASHIHIVNDATVVEYLRNCDLPKEVNEIDLTGHIIHECPEDTINPIKHVFAIDGGYTEVPVRSKFPSSTLALFQTGASYFGINDLNNIAAKPFIEPEDMAKLKEIQRFKMALPVKNIVLTGESSLIDTVRRTIYDFFCNEPRDDNDKLIDTLEWFIYEEYCNGSNQWSLASCPSCQIRDVKLKKDEMSKEHTFVCSNCGKLLYLTDVFRLHEAVDNELGAGGILGYVTTLLEQLVLVHLIRIILKTKPGLLDEMLFLKDGPLAFFGQTANLHQPMRILCTYLAENYNIYLAGLEKSGPFVDHADQIASVLKARSVLLLSNKYIYSYILPGKADDNSPYARSSYYGSKLIYKSTEGRMYVITIPTKSAEVVLSPKPNDFNNLYVILRNIEKLKCDMYDNALIPVALANKLVSLAHHPSSVILEKFVRSNVGNKS